jgi:prolyl oligopeptidase
MQRTYDLTDYVLGICAVAMSLAVFASGAAGQTVAAQPAVTQATVAQTGGAQATDAKCPPVARVADTTDTYGDTTHGTTVVADPYRWLEEQDSAETRAWIGAEQACTTAALSKITGREAVAKRFAELLHTDEVAIPVERHGRYFFRKRLAGEELAKIYMRRGRDGADEVLVDPLPWSADHSASALLVNVSPDGKFAYYARRDGGKDEIAIHVLDVDARKELPDVLPAADYFGVEPTPDDRAVYYSKATADGPRAYVHMLGSDPAKDQLLFGESLGKDKILTVTISDDGNYLAYVVVYGSGSEQSEVYLQDLKNHGPVVPVVTGVKALFNPAFGDANTLYITTNWKAPHWHVFATSLATPSQEHWREIIPERDATLENLVAASGKVVVQYLHNVTSQVEIRDAEGKNPTAMPLPGLGTAQVTGRWSSPEIFYSFQSFDLPETIYSRVMASGASSVWFKQKIPFDSAGYQTEQVWYESKDHTRIPMFLFHKKGLKFNGSSPVLLTGYGGFDLNETPRFSARFAIWAEHGGIVAYPNLRGGGEFGEEWHRAGMFEKKQNVFDDFIAAAEFLINNRYTNASRLAIRGASNGGLLMGAMITQRPELFQAVVCLYPLLDMLRFQKFMEGPYWVPEYGSAENAEQFQYIHAYSPYHRVEKGKKYPAVMFVTGDGDTRVAPLHARKMAALLQAETGSERPVLLLYDTKSGHSGGRPISKEIEEDTDELSFLFWQLHVPLQ